MAFERTIDWREYWADADDEARADASPSAELLLDPLLALLDERGEPGLLADIGCGIGTVPFAGAIGTPRRPSSPASSDRLMNAEWVDYLNLRTPADRVDELVALYRDALDFDLGHLGTRNQFT